MLQAITNLGGRVFRRVRRQAATVARSYWPTFFRERLIRRHEPLRLHLGCGNNRLEGYVNIDLRMTAATDIVSDITRLPFRNNSVKRIELYHVIEHLPRTTVAKGLQHWFRLLQKGGIVVIECPDFDQAVREYLAGNEHRLASVYGLQRYASDFHLWGWNTARLSQVLAEAGFSAIKALPAADYHSLEEPCIRVEAQK